jgi:hypothetical protein
VWKIGLRQAAARLLITVIGLQALGDSVERHEIWTIRRTSHRLALYMIKALSLQDKKS